MQIINTTNLNEARKQIQKLKKDNKQIVIQAQDNEFNRKILENPNVDIFLSPELHDRKDRLKQRDSGLNEILCKIAAKNNIKIGININEIAKLPKIKKAQVLARVIQNIKLCKRTKTKIIIFPKKYGKQEVASFFLSLKGSTTQVKNALF